MEIFGSFSRRGRDCLIFYVDISINNKFKVEDFKRVFCEYFGVIGIYSRVLGEVIGNR